MDDTERIRSAHEFSTQQVKEYLTGLQQRIVERLEEVDGKFSAATNGSGPKAAAD